MALLSDQWLAGLDPHLQEMIVIASGSMEDFASNVRAADILALLSFRRAMDAVNNPQKLSETEVSARIELARKTNAQAALVKTQRLEMMDKFESISDVPQAARVEYVIVTAPIRQQIERLRALGYTKEADLMEDAEKVDAPSGE